MSTSHLDRCERLTAAPSETTIGLRVLSLGADVQSTMFALMAGRGIIGLMPELCRLRRHWLRADRRLRSSGLADCTERAALPVHVVSARSCPSLCRIVDVVSFGLD
jgi:hypothetical protein